MKGARLLHPIIVHLEVEADGRAMMFTHYAGVPSYLRRNKKKHA